MVFYQGYAPSKFILIYKLYDVYWYVNAWTCPSLGGGLSCAARTPVAFYELVRYSWTAV